MYEVEQKYPVADVAELEGRLGDAGALWHGVVEQVDRYFGHPSRDFAVTDEALRLRSTADGVVITWKGPRLDAAAKTRREIELPLAEAAVPAAANAEAAVPATANAEAAVPAVAAGPAATPALPRTTLERWTDLLESLGFRRVREVAKRRRLATVAWDGVRVDVSLDHIAGLGDFVEFELQADAAGIALAADRVDSLARHLGCMHPEPRSYLEMLVSRP